MTPAEVILRKNLVASGLSSAEWSKVSAGLRDRAFFSSRVESLRFLETCRAQIAELLSSSLSGRAASAAPSADGRAALGLREGVAPRAVASPSSSSRGAGASSPAVASPLPSRASVVSALMRAARESGIATGEGGLTDPGSVRRASVIVDTNAGLAAGYCAAEQANTYGARLAFPAQELVRLEARLKPRDWSSRWRSLGGALYRGRMIALKGDPIWVRLSRFGQPYPPFDFNSGMGLDDVSFDEAVALGLISPSYQPPVQSPLNDFNSALEADLNAADGNLLASLREMFGDQITVSEGKVKWRPR